MPSLEKRKAELAEELTQVTDNHEEIMRISDELTKIVDQLDEMEMRWLELSELIYKVRVYPYRNKKGLI